MFVSKIKDNNTRRFFGDACTITSMREQAQFETIQGKRVFTVFSEPDDGSKTIVIMCHGFKGSTVGAARSFVTFTRLLVENEISVLRFDQPCSGNSEGDFSDSSFTGWVDTVSHFVTMYINLGYKVALLGHSMGATTALVAATCPELSTKIPLLILWAPDPKSNKDEWFLQDAKLIDEKTQLFEEGGLQFHAKFWQEVLDADFFECLQQYQGKIHLVYGESDKFVSAELKNRVIQAVTEKNQTVLVLEGQDHMLWEHDSCKKVFAAELALIRQTFALK